MCLEESDERNKTALAISDASAKVPRGLLSLYLCKNFFDFKFLSFLFKTPPGQILLTLTLYFP